jgi:hypothetical protein
MKSKNNGKLLTITCCALPITDEACRYFSSLLSDIKITFGKQFAE